MPCALPPPPHSHTFTPLCSHTYLNLFHSKGDPFNTMTGLWVVIAAWVSSGGEHHDERAALVAIIFVSVVLTFWGTTLEEALVGSTVGLATSTTNSPLKSAAYKEIGDKRQHRRSNVALVSIALTRVVLALNHYATLAPTAAGPSSFSSPPKALRMVFVIWDGAMAQLVLLPPLASAVMLVVPSRHRHIGSLWLCRGNDDEHPRVCVCVCVCVCARKYAVRLLLCIIRQFQDLIHVFLSWECLAIPPELSHKSPPRLSTLYRSDQSQ